MNGLPYYKAYPRDFIEGTIGMPFEIKCAYRVILDLIYMQGGNLPDDDRYISGLLGCSIRKWKSIRNSLIEADKIQVSGDFLTNYRAEKELETLAKLQDKQRDNRSRPNKNKDLRKPRSDQPEPEPEPDKEEKKERAAQAPSCLSGEVTDLFPVSKQKEKPPPKARLPEDWVPSGDAVEYAIDANLNDREIEEIANDFRTYWTEERRDVQSRKTENGWRMCWQANVRRVAQQYIRNRSMAGIQFPGRSGQGGGMAGELARRRLGDQN